MKIILHTFLVALISVLATLGAGVLAQDDKDGAKKEDTPVVYVSKEFSFQFDHKHFPKKTLADTVKIGSFHTAQAGAGFSANINIMIQYQKVTPETYLKNSKAELKEFDGILIDSTIEDNIVNTEFKATFDGKTSLHFWSKAIILEDRVILITATVLESDAKDMKEKVVETLNSYKPLD